MWVENLVIPKVVMIFVSDVGEEFSNPEGSDDFWWVMWVKNLVIPKVVMIFMSDVGEEFSNPEGSDDFREWCGWRI